MSERPESNWRRVRDGGVNFRPDGEDYCLNRLWFIIFASIFSLALRMCGMWVSAFVSTRMSSDTLVTAFGVITQVRLGVRHKIRSYSSQVHVRVNEWMNSMEASHTSYFDQIAKKSLSKWNASHRNGRAEMSVWNAIDSCVTWLGNHLFRIKLMNCLQAADHLDRYQTSGGASNEFYFVHT